MLAYRCEAGSSQEGCEMRSLRAHFCPPISSGCFVATLLRMAVMWGLVISTSAHIADAQAGLPISNLNIGAHDPLYTTYAAPLSRSEYLVDEGYFLNYFSPGEGVTYATDTSGSFALGWRLGNLAAFATKDFYKPPVIHRSYSDLVELEYWPFTTIQVRETFDVYSSRFAILNVEIANWDSKPQELTCYAYFERQEPISSAAIEHNQYVTFAHHVDPKAWSETPPPQFDPDFHDVFLLSGPADEWGGYAEAADIGRANQSRQADRRGFRPATRL